MGRPVRSGRAEAEQHAGEGHRGDQDAEAPGDRPQGAGPEREAEEQAAQGLDDRGDGLVAGEPVDPARHGVDGDEGAARVGPNRIRKLTPPAASGEGACRPTAADSQEMARVNSRSIPTADSQSSGPALGRNPIRKATPNTRTVEARLRTTLAATW